MKEGNLAAGSTSNYKFSPIQLFCQTSGGKQKSISHPYKCVCWDPKSHYERLPYSNILIVYICVREENEQTNLLYHWFQVSPSLCFERFGESNSEMQMKRGGTTLRMTGQCPWHEWHLHLCWDIGLLFSKRKNPYQPLASSNTECHSDVILFSFSLVNY